MKTAVLVSGGDKTWFVGVHFDSLDAKGGDRVGVAGLS